MTTSISNTAFASAVCIISETGTPEKAGKYTENSQPGAAMIAASLAASPVKDIYEIPAGNAEHTMLPATLSALAAVSEYLELQHLQAAEVETDRKSPLVPPDSPRSLECARQLSASAVRLIVGEENAARPLAVDLCKAAYLDLHDNLSRMAFFSGGRSAGTEDLVSAKGVTLEIATAFLNEDLEEYGDAPDISAAARQLNEWSRENDIGLEILRMFVATWNQLRNTLRAERQMQIAEIRQLSRNAVAALIQQGKDKFMQDALSAWGAIASSAVQLSALGIHAAYKRVQFKNNKTLAFELSKNPAVEDAQLARNTKSNIQHTKATNLSNVLQISRAVGEGVQGFFNLFAAYYGLDAAYDNAEFTRMSNKMQAENIELENMNARGEAAWQNMLQILGNIAERQNRLYEANIRIAHV